MRKVKGHLRLALFTLLIKTNHGMKNFKFEKLEMLLKCTVWMIFLYFHLQRTIDQKLKREKLRLNFSLGWKECGNCFCLILPKLLLRLKHFKSLSIKLISHV